MSATAVRADASSSRAAGSRIGFWRAVSIATVILFLLILVYPLARMIISTFVGGSAAGDAGIWATYVELFTKPYYYVALINSLVLSVAVTVCALMIGVPVAYCVTRFDIPGKLFIKAAIVLTFISPPFIGAYSWVLLFGDSGVLRQAVAGAGITLPSIYGWPGLILVLTLQGFPFVFLMVSAALKSIDQTVEDAAINLGRRPLAAVRTAILPLIVPSISTGALLVFVTAFSDIGTPAILGHNLRVFPRLIYNEYINETSGGDFRTATGMSVVLLLITVGALLFQRRYAARRSHGQECVRPLAVRKLRRRGRLVAMAAVYGVIGVACLPLATVVFTSFLETEQSVLTSTVTVAGYVDTPGLWSSLGNTVMLTTAATTICVVVGCLVGYVIARQRTRLGSVIDAASMVPYAVAGVVMGIAFSLAFGGAPLYLAGTPLILVAVYFARRLPYSIRSVSGMLSQVGTQTEEASVNLGVPPAATFWKITVPIIGPAVVSGALLTWATVAREFNATIILYGADTMTLPIGVFREVLYGNYSGASVMGTMLIALSAVPIIALFRLLGKDEDFLI